MEQALGTMISLEQEAEVVGGCWLRRGRLVRFGWFSRKVDLMRAVICVNDVGVL